MGVERKTFFIEYRISNKIYIEYQQDGIFPCFHFLNYVKNKIVLEVKLKHLGRHELNIYFFGLSFETFK